MSLFGREHELAVLRGALVDATGGAGRLVLLSGEAGAGKSRLIEELLSHAGGVPVARGHAVDDAGAPALWPWTRLLRALPAVAEVAAHATDAVLSGAAQRFRLFAELADAMVAAAEPGGLVLVLEDVHWADRSSLLLLRQVCGELAASRLLVVASHRPALDGPLAELEPDLLRSPAAVVLPLGGLRVDDVSAWLAELRGPRRAEPGLAALLHERTGGNALFVRLLAEALPHDGPADAAGLRRVVAARPQLRRLITARTAALSPAAQHLVAVAAVLGERVPHGLLPAASGLAPPDVATAVDEACRAGVLGESSEHPGAWVFPHALVRDAVYDDLPAPRRARLHRQAALAIEADASLGQRAGRIATQWRRAGGEDDLRRCARWAGAAADDAAASFAVDEAAAFAEMALHAATAGGAGAGDRAELMLRLADARYAAGSLAEAMRLCVDTAAAAESAGRPDLAAQAALVVRGVGDPQVVQDTMRLARQALERLGEGEDEVTRCRLLAQLATAETHLGHLDAAQDHSAQAIATAEATGDPDAVLDAIRARHLALAVPERVAERLALGSRAVEVGGTARQPVAELWGHLWRADAAMQLGSLAVFDEETGQVERVATRHRSTLARWHLLRLRAVRTALVGEFAAARELNAEAGAVGVRMGDFSAEGMSQAFQPAAGARHRRPGRGR
ncbi:ATP-binding protein [Pseudonocardia humida]|uniref:AAA family ATPase n=1 Tax=Pseudonocardia humida TaxID=2800819 RepID=A0ABT1ABZ9_9PSEU|nr:AAA family ATPase [Pseudonocardia humida]MCO1660567.1 AAA family ATPase [Pseudonocardia humida]